MASRKVTRSSVKHWIWVTGPEYYWDEDGLDTAHLDPNATVGPEGWWTCSGETRMGDLILLYRTSPARDFAYLIQAASNAFPIDDEFPAQDHGWTYGCEYRPLLKFVTPLPLREVRADPELRDWGPIRSNLQGRAFAVPFAVWRRLKTTLEASNPDLTKVLKQTVPKSARRFQSEKALEDWLEKNLRRLKPFGFHLDILERQKVCGGMGRIDLLRVDNKTGGYVVIELKNARATRDAAGQVAAYLGWVAWNLPNRRKPRGLVIASGEDSAFRNARRAVPRLEFVSLDDLRPKLADA